MGDSRVWQMLGMMITHRRSSNEYNVAQLVNHKPVLPPTDIRLVLLSKTFQIPNCDAGRRVDSL